MKWLFSVLLMVCCNAPFEFAKAENSTVKLNFITPGIAYNPRNFSIKNELLPANFKKQIIDDLRILKSAGFRSLVTYSAKNELGIIPQLAREIGFDGLIIMGIWDPDSQEEWNNALKQIPFVSAFCIGNEGLGERYSPKVLGEKMNKLRKATNLPVTTTEPVVKYLKGPTQQWLLENSDWLFPFTQPYWAHQLDSREATNWIVTRYDYLGTLTKKMIILKEAGLPTIDSEGLTEKNQTSFFQRMESLEIPFFYFEGFDQPWKKDELNFPEAEAHWGLFRKDGTPKQVVPWIKSRGTN